MGGGSWSRSTYSHTTADAMRSHGTAFTYDHDTKRKKPRHEWSAHEDLDPRRKNGAGAHAGLITRESLDTDEHPLTVPIAVIFDVTGSMKTVPQVLQSKLPTLHGLLMRRGHLEHPQVLFGAVGDAYSDRVPLQVSQFESDNRMDQHLSNIFLEGGGGGGNHESYELAAWFLAHHTHLDSWERRGQKGYAFFIGDERPYATLKRAAVAAVVGEEHAPAQDLATTEVFRALQERYHTFFLFAQEGSYDADHTVTAAPDATRAGWRDLLGQHALILEDASAVSETIALTVGLMEGAFTLEEAMEGARGGAGPASPGALAAAGKALSRVTTPGGGAVVAAEGGSLEAGDEEPTGGGVEAL